MNSVPSVNGQILDLFVRMLCKPSHLFLKVMEKRFFISLRHMFSRSIVKCLQANRDKNLIKSILFTFLKAFTPAQKTGEYTELLNAMALIANLVKVLDDKEVSCAISYL
jgi:hypothetical protein